MTRKADIEELLNDWARAELGYIQDVMYGKESLTAERRIRKEYLRRCELFKIKPTVFLPFIAPS